MKQINYIYRGEVERGTGQPGYRWHPGYSEDSADGKPLYPWMTIAECRADAKARGAKALLVNPNQRYPKAVNPPSDYGDNAQPCPECSATGQHYQICSKGEM